MHRHPHSQILGATLLFEDIVVEEYAFRSTPVFGEHRHQPSSELASEVFGNGPNVGITQKEIDFIFTVGAHRLDLPAKLLPQGLKHCGHGLRHHPPTTMPTAL